MADYAARTQSGFVWTTATAAGLIAFVLSASRINHGLVDSPLPDGPGLALDESINVRQGQYLFDAFCQHGPLMMLPGTAQEVYGHPDYLPDHVPLARFLLGAAHSLTSWLISGAEQSVANIPAARLASSLGLALTIGLLVFFVHRRLGIGTALVSAALLVAMPRVVGHSRIATQETLTTLAWLAALLPLLAWWTGDRPPIARQTIVSGLLWGILMLTKIQGILLPPVIVIWALLRFRWKAIPHLFLWGITGMLLFFCGWPWLWLDPIGNTTAYLLSTAERPAINCWYLGEQFRDRAVPWHYPFVITVVTIPVHATLCALLRCLQRKRDPVDLLLVLSIIVPLTVFALPGTPVYDGTRLFLFVMPAIALLAGRGITGVCRTVASRRDSGGIALVKRIAGTVFLFLLLADYALSVLALGPMAADEYNSLVKRPDSSAPTFESCYWGLALNGDFWKQVPKESTVYVAPVLHQVLLQDMQTMVPVIQHRKIRLEPFLYDPNRQRGLILLVYRLADLRPDLRKVPEGARVVAEVSLRGAILARLVDTSNATWEEVREW